MYLPQAEETAQGTLKTLERLTKKLDDKVGKSDGDHKVSFAIPLAWALPCKIGHQTVTSFRGCNIFAPIAEVL